MEADPQRNRARLWPPGFAARIIGRVAAGIHAEGGSMPNDKGHGAPMPCGAERGPKHRPGSFGTSTPTHPKSTRPASYLSPKDALRRVLERSRARQAELVYAGPSPTHSSGWA